MHLLFSCTTNRKASLEGFFWRLYPKSTGFVHTFPKRGAASLYRSSGAAFASFRATFVTAKKHSNGNCFWKRVSISLTRTVATKVASLWHINWWRIFISHHLIVGWKFILALEVRSSIELTSDLCSKTYYLLVHKWLITQRSLTGSFR